MIPLFSRAAFGLYLFASWATMVGAQVFTIEIPRPPPAFTSNLIVAHGENWHWHRGTNMPPTDWFTAPDAGLDASWLVGPGGFGYGDDAISGEATRVNPGMLNVHSTLFVRRSFTVSSGVDPAAQLVLTVDYDDGFVAYLDGTEVARRNVPGAPGSVVTNTLITGVSHEASCCQSPNPPVAINLGTAANWMTPGSHTLALVGVNQALDSSDFHLIPDLALVTSTAATNLPLVNRGLYALATEGGILLRGSNTLAGSVRVTVDGDDAAFDTATGEWSLARGLMPGFNRLQVAAHNSAGDILTNAVQDIVYEVSSRRMGGVLGGVNAWSDPATVIYVTNQLLLPAEASLNIGAGVVVILAPGASIVATTNASFQVNGSEAMLVRFLPESGPWTRLMAIGTNATMDLRYADIVAGQVRVAEHGSALLEDCSVRDRPDTGIQMIEAVNGAALILRRSYLTRFAEGDSSNTPVLAEGCLLEGFLVDGLDIKATNAPLVVRRSTFRRADPNNANADAIDFGPGAGTVEDCLIHSFPDKGVSLGGAPGTVIRNTLIYNCGIGISAYASLNVAVENVTIHGCRTGVLLRDNPTRAVAAMTNLIVWGNTTNLGIYNTSILSLSHSDVQDTNYPGDANLSMDPLFLNAAVGDFRLATNSPARGAGVNGRDLGVAFPVGGIPSPPAALVARANASGGIRLTWEDTAENEDGVLVQRSTDGVNWEMAGVASRDATEFADVSVRHGDARYYRVRSSNDVGVSPWSNRARGVAIGPVTLRIERWESGQVVVSFEAAARRGYTLQTRNSFESGAWSDLLQIPATATGGTIRLTNSISGPTVFFQLITP